MHIRDSSLYFLILQNQYFFSYQEVCMNTYKLKLPKFSDGYDENEELLRQFDTNMTYGPCLGLSRLDRWERAKSFGLNPPTDVEPILRSKVRNECLWDGMV